MGEAVIKPALHHINLKTTRLQQMLDWYGMVVGLKANFQFPGGAFATNDRANHRIAFLSLPGLEDDENKNKHTGMHHSAFEYESFDDLMASYRRLKALGITPQACLDHAITTSLYYVDPDGNMVELQFDNFGDWEKSANHLRTSEEFARDPIGTFFDPDKVLAAHEAGATFVELRNDTRAGKFLPDSPPSLSLLNLP
jgi:catechol 2,3-dioxygenase